MYMHSESLREEPGNEKLKKFNGWPAVLFPAKKANGSPGMAEDPEACNYFIRDANARNALSTQMTILDKLEKAEESSCHHVIIIGDAPLHRCTDSPIGR